MADNLKFLEREILNKVLNAGEDALNVDLTAGGSAMLVDDAAFTPGTSTVQMVGAEFDDTGPDSVDEGDAGAIRMSANRNLYTTIRDAAGNERGVNVNSSSQLLVDGSGVTQPVSGTVSVSGLLADGHAVTIDNASDDEVYVRGSGSAGSADAGVITVQGIGSGTALAVTESSPISGFATSANQLADGHNVTIDNSSGGSAVNIQDGGNTITVDGTVTANLSDTDNAVLDTIDAVLDTIKTDTGTIDSDTDAIKTATESSNTHLGNMLYGTALVVDYSGGDHSLGATYEAFYIGVGGDLSLDCVNGAVNVVFKNLASGQLLPVRATVVNQSGTDATNIVALKA